MIWQILALVLFSGDKPVSAAKRYQSLPYITINDISILKQLCLIYCHVAVLSNKNRFLKELIRVDFSLDNIDK
jgi:hypothetical protein